MDYTDITKAYKRACEEEGKTIDFLAFKKGYESGVDNSGMLFRALGTIKVEKKISNPYTQPNSVDECKKASENFFSRNSCSSCDSFDRNNNWCTNFGRHTEAGDICKWYRRTEFKMK